MAALLASLPGCAGRLGPAAVRLTRTDYNIAAQETGAQQLLLNLVRLRYRDTPYFLQIASLSTNMRVRGGIGANGVFPSRGPEIGSIEGTFSVEESPTLTYTPLVGELFVSQLLEPIEPEILLLLSHTGWSMDRFFRLFVQEIEGVVNAPTASGPTPDQKPVYEDFLRISELLRILQSRRQIMLIGGRLTGRSGTKPRESQDGVLLRFTEEAFETDEYLELAERLSLEPGRETFELVTGIGSRVPHRINLVLRSVLSSMFYASHGIDVPEEDRAEGRVTTTESVEGEAFDWDLVTGSLLRIASGKPDSSPYVDVRYRGNNFYIDDTDLDSKSTFSMLSLVLSLQAGQVPSGGPVLTLPISQ